MFGEVGMNVIDYELIEDVSILFSSKIILYGIGYWGEKVFECLKEMGIDLKVVCQTKATEKTFHDLRVKSLVDVLNRFDHDQYLIIVASTNYYAEMMEMCLSSEKVSICTLYGFYTSIKLHVNEDILPKTFREKVKAGVEVSREFFFPRLKLSAVNRFVQAALAPEDHIWIFQPGKVGSQSIWNALQDKSVQFHTLAGAYKFADVEKEYLDYYMQLIHGKKIKIISVVREPISRDIAAFFQNSDLNFWPYHEFNCNIFAVCGDGSTEPYINVKELKKRCPVWKESLNKSFGELAHAIMCYKQDVFSWFDSEIKKIFGIDVYDYPFDQKKGYTVIEKDNVQILLMKMERLTELENVIGDFIGDERYRLINRNSASNKMYRFAYDGFKRNVKISPDYFDFYYHGNTQYKHFYSHKEIEENARHWKKYVSEK